MNLTSLFTQEPCGNLVMLKVSKIEVKTGLIVIPDTVEEKSDYAVWEILAAGPDCKRGGFQVGDLCMVINEPFGHKGFPGVAFVDENAIVCVIRKKESA